MAGTDLETKFRQAVERLHACPLQKLTVIGPWRFAVRYGARLLRMRAERTVDLFFDVLMTIVLPEVISEQIYTYGLFDESVTWLALQAVHEGDTVIDVGAHFGYFTLLFSHVVGNSGRVIALEPTPSTFAILSKNAERVKNITALNVAAGRNARPLRISDFGLKYSAWNTLSGASRMPEVLGEAGASVEVDVIRLDDWLAKKKLTPNVIKVDAENFESEVMAGLTHTIDVCRPHILMEVGSPQALDAGKILLDRGYHVLVSDGFGSLKDQTNALEDVNIRYKDVLFVHSSLACGFVLST